MSSNSGGTGRMTYRRNSNYRRYSNYGYGPPPQSNKWSEGDDDIAYNTDMGSTSFDRTTIAKYLRKISRDNETEKCISAAKQVQTYLYTSDAVKTVPRYLDDILAVFHDILLERHPRAVKDELVCCIGLLGYVLAPSFDKYLQWIFSETSNLANDNTSSLYYRALLETLKCDKKKEEMLTHIPTILKNLQSSIENADTPSLLMSSMDAVLYISHNYPHIFNTHFRDTVDILVGWHIDCTQKREVTEYTSEALISLQSFWVADLNFSFTLLGQFLEDMEAYTEDLTITVTGQGLQDDEMPQPDECVTKICSLLRVFTTVMMSLGDNISHTQTVSPHYMSDVVTRTIHCTQSTLQCAYSESLLVATYNCVVLLLKQMAADTPCISDTLMPFITTQVHSTHSPSHESSSSLLTLLKKVIDLCNTQLPVSFITDLLSPSTLLYSLRYSNNKQILNCLMGVYHSIMGLKSVPLLEEAYKHVVGDLQMAYNTLLDHAGDPLHLQIIVDNPLGGAQYDVTRARTIVAFNLCVLSEIGNTKNNLIGMWALSPSIFNLFSTHLRPLNTALMEWYPCVHYSALYTLYSHCVRHENFVSSSELLTRRHYKEGSLLASVSPATSGQFGVILNLLAGLLQNHSSSYDTRCLCLKWTGEVVSSLKASTQVYSDEKFIDIIQGLVSNGYSNEIQLSLSAAQCLIDIFTNSADLPRYLTVRCVELCMVKVSCTDSSVGAAYLRLLACLPLDVVIASNSMTYIEGQRSDKQSPHTIHNINADRRAYMARLPPRTFQSHDFTIVMTYLLNQKNIGEKDSLWWIENLFHSSQRSDKETPALANVIDGNRSVLWWWVCLEAAQFCVMSRLKTPLGKPQDTFTKIEDVLKAYSQRARDATPESSTDKETGDLYNSRSHVVLLLRFLEYLEKLLYNAYEGCAISLPLVPKLVRTFFRTNRATCQEWLLRIRLPATTVALHAGLPALAVHHVTQLLMHLHKNARTQTTEFEQAVVSYARALSDLPASDALQGVDAWCREVIGRRFTWLKPLVAKARGSFEDSLVELKAIVKNDVSVPGSGNGGIAIQSSLSTVTPFLVDQVAESYMKLADWTGVAEWVRLCDGYMEQNGNHLLRHHTPTLEFIKEMASFEGHTLLTDESFIQNSNSGITGGVSWDIRACVETSSIHLVRSAGLLQMFNALTDKRDAVASALACVIKPASHVLQVPVDHWPLTVHSQSLVHLTAASLLSSLSDSASSKTLPLTSDLHLEPQLHDLTSILQVQQLVDYHRKLCISSNQKVAVTRQLMTAQIATARLCRKQHNFTLAERLLHTNIRLLLTDAHDISLESDDLLTSVYHLRSAPRYDKTQILMVERETAKLFYAVGRSRDALDLITSSALDDYDTVSPNDSGRSDDGYRGYATIEYNRRLSGNYQHGGADKGGAKNKSDDAARRLNARSMLHAQKWLCADQKYLASLEKMVDSDDGGGGAQTCTTAKNLKILLKQQDTGNVDSLTCELIIVENGVMTDSDSLLGRLLHLSTMESPDLAKCWFTFATWCYKWGRKAIDSSSHGMVELTTEELENIHGILPIGVPETERNDVIQLLGRISSPGGSEDDIIEQNQLSFSDGSEGSQRQHLVNSLPSHADDEDLVNRLLDAWKQVVARVYHYYQLSARCYFTFLQLNGETGECSEDGNVVATLRLLRLLVKHAWELREVIEDNLACTPTAPWKGIIPQLFSRLNHPESYVRQSVCDLLCRVSQDAPHLIVYPAVVGCTSLTDTSQGITQPGILNNYMGESDDEEQTLPDDEIIAADDTGDKMLQNCLAMIVDSLTHYNPKMIGDVQQFVQELRRITLLWDELWLGTLNQYHADTMRRIARLEAEVSKVMYNTSLAKEERAAIIREKHKTIMKPIVYVMERVHNMITKPAETPHEQWFQDVYGQQISDALDKLRDPPNPSNPQSSWSLFKQIHHSLQQRSQKRSSFLLQMRQISPTLAALAGTVIPMSGLSSDAQSVTVTSIQNTIQILPTKTKPKKLIISGSDGKKYTYLFKGLEDLHLDERIMQLLSIINNMFSASNRGRQLRYRARHYAVTPLGPRSGLIQWVDGATPLFGMYKRWQQRELAYSNKSGTSTSASNVPRPSDIYYSKLRPALQDKGISTREENRKEWPTMILKDVLEQLLRETPDDLLAKELWCSSVNAREWWHITQVYSVSMAVMSMIGYIIGLGDRHLDNVLVDLSTGEVVHIDYNVCFEKGKGLRVPEKVPCRLTQNIVGALGVTGIEGTFRIACEHVLKTMRKGRETLLTLLEAFLYDPLVDWTTASEDGLAGAFYGGGGAGQGQNDGQQSKKELDRHITQSMFSIRIAEMKSAWFINRDEMLACLPNIEAELMAWLDVDTEYTLVQESHDEMLELKFFVKNALNDPNHGLHSLARRYHEYAMVEQSKADALMMVNKKTEECQDWSLVHERVVLSGSNGTFQRMCNNVTTVFNPGLPAFLCSIDFLQGAGQAQVVSQCEEIERELTGCLNQRHSVLATTLDILNTYISVTGHFGQYIVIENRIWQYCHWLRELLADFTSIKCMQLIDRVRKKYVTPSSMSSAQSILSTELKLQAIITDSNARLAKLIERRAQDGSSIDKLARHVNETNSNISTFLHDNESSGAYSLVAVILTALCQLDKRYLVMEGAAAAAGDRLMDLTSRQGDWFLDELCSMSATVMQFLDILKQIATETNMMTSDNLQPSFVASHKVYRALHEMNINFRMVILPEALKTMQANDSSILSVLHELEEICTDANRPMDSLLSQLEVQHRNTIMDIESDSTDVTGVVELMKQRFSQLIQGPWIETGQLTAGQMLLMAFNGLFTALDTEFANMIACLEQAEIPASWCKIDVVKEAKSLQISSFSGQAKVILSDIFFVKRLLTMKEFLGICHQFAETIHGESGVCFDDEQLSKPIKKFIAEFVRMQVLGFPSQIIGYLVCAHAERLDVDVAAKVSLKDIGAEFKVPVEELCKEAIDRSVKSGLFRQHHVTQAGVVLASHETALRKHDWARRLDENQMLLENCVERVRMELARYQWIHEESLTAAGHQARDMLIPSHSGLMADLQKCMQTIVSHDATIISCLSRYTQLESGITQRLKWAAGANHTLNTVMQKYDEAIAFRQQAVEAETKLSSEVVGLCQGVLHLETYRNKTAEAKTSDASIISLLHKCEESCMLQENRKASVSEIEMRIINLEATPPVTKIDCEWLEKTLGAIKQEIKNSNHNLSQHKAAVGSAQDKILSSYEDLRAIIATHHKLMLDVRKILVSLDKYERQDNNDEVAEGGISEWLVRYRELLDNITVANKLFTEDLGEENIARVTALLVVLKGQTVSVYDDLVAFASPLVTEVNPEDSKENSAGSEKKGSEVTMRKSFEVESMSPQPTTTVVTKPVAPVSSKKTEKITRDPRTGKAIQGRNSYAMGVWRRVKMKLDGRDPDANKRLTVPEQVDFVLREATSLDNLAVLYEGWTPWV